MLITIYEDCKKPKYPNHCHFCDECKKKHLRDSKARSQLKKMHDEQSKGEKER